MERRCHHGAARALWILVLSIAFVIVLERVGQDSETLDIFTSVVLSPGRVVLLVLAAPWASGRPIRTRREVIASPPIRLLLLEEGRKEP